MKSTESGEDRALLVEANFGLETGFKFEGKFSEVIQHGEEGDHRFRLDVPSMRNNAERNVDKMSSRQK